MLLPHSSDMQNRTEMTGNDSLFQVISLGATKVHPQVTTACSTIDQLHEFLSDQQISSVIVIRSSDVSFDTISWKELPEICAVYNEDLTRLYCVADLVSSVDEYMKEKRKNEKKKEGPSFIRKYWFLLGLILVIGLAYLFPDVGKTGGYIRAEWSVKWGCVMFIFLLSGLSLRTKQLGKELLRIRLHLFIQIFSFVVIPFSVFGLVVLLTKFTSFNRILLIGLLVMSSTSTTISSNVVMTKNAGGNEYVALLNAVIGNLMGIFLSPALIFFLMKNSSFDQFDEQQGRFDYLRVIRNLSLTVLLPLFVGQLIHVIFTERVLRWKEKFYFAELNSLALLTLVWSVFCTSFANRSFDLISKIDLFILVLVNSAIYLLSSLLIFAIARLPIRRWRISSKDTIALIFCGATKTLAMGIPLINAVYGARRDQSIGLVSLPLIIYHVQQLIFGAFQVIHLKRWNERITRATTTTGGEEAKPMNR